MRDAAAPMLSAFMKAACDARGVEPEEIEESDVKAALTGPVARLAVPQSCRKEVPAVCSTFLAWLETEGRLGGGRLLGAYAAALAGSYTDAATGKPKPVVRAGSKLGRNDPCPCGSGKKYKKCCMRE
jgi:preprotein translocase subunit SecA